MNFDVFSLGDDGLAEFERLSAELSGRVFDRGALLRYCAAVDVAADLYADIKVRGVIVDGRRSGDLVKNPSTSQFLAAVLAVANLAKAVPVADADRVPDAAEDRARELFGE